jgi:hypothetical protein
VTATNGVDAPGSRGASEPEQVLSGVGWIASPAARLNVTPSHALAPLKGEFPHIPVALTGEASSGSVVISEAEWGDSVTDPARWDEVMAGLALRPGWVYVRADLHGHDTVDTIGQVLTRYQRLAPRTNELSRSAGFARALSAHRRLHDLSKPLVRADYDHALDVWQWVLRLSRGASLALQLGALFHDIERLFTEADQRVEQHAPDYQAFKDAHARAGAEVAERIVLASGLGEPVAGDVKRLVERHEVSSADSRHAESSILGDADALSFFSLNSSGFANYYGARHTQMKVRYSLRRMSGRARQRLHHIKLRSDIALYLAEARAAERGAEGSHT